MYSVPGDGEYPSFSSLNELIDYYRNENSFRANGVEIKLLKVCRDFISLRYALLLVDVLFHYCLKKL